MDFLSNLIAPVNDPLLTQRENSQAMLDWRNQNPIQSGFSQFAQTPQGQAALLSFAQAAMRASMNPRTPKGIGLMSAISSGLQGHKDETEKQADLEWGEERKGMLRKGQEMQEQEHRWRSEDRGKADIAYKIGQIVDFGDFRDSKGTVHKVKKQYLGGDPNEDKSWKVAEDVTVDPKTAKAQGFASGYALAAIAAGVYPDNPWGISKEEALATLNTYKQMGMNPFQQLLFGGGMGGGMPATPNFMPTPGGGQGVQGLSDKELEDLAGQK